MVGQLGAARLGALSIGGSIVSVSFPVFNFFSYATTPMVARALAKQDPKEASRLVAQVPRLTAQNISPSRVSRPLSLQDLSRV